MTFLFSAFLHIFSRGCFNGWNKKYKLDGVVAHLSDKESQSVSEKAKLLFLNLHFVMLPKANLWPKFFNTSKATTDDIELFFFPSEARYDWWRACCTSINAIWGVVGFHIHRTAPESLEATQGSSSCLLVPNRIQSGMVRQTPDNVLVARDIVNDRVPTEVNAQVITIELAKGKRIKRRDAKLDDYV
ncbi:hypothetical protein KY285_023802 [Solanum tuberosum]|nr:hypothetical protein KY289_024135 [Solanum tuberosum]KAH0676001.1 hypothetical protein KY285_023802 [Solanum tuberosum]